MAYTLFWMKSKSQIMRNSIVAWKKECVCLSRGPNTSKSPFLISPSDIYLNSLSHCTLHFFMFKGWEDGKII
jgi:hypothetical protein